MAHERFPLGPINERLPAALGIPRLPCATAAVTHTAMPATETQREETAAPSNGRHPGGRPSDYTPELAEEICEILATNRRGLNAICDEEPDFPSPRTVNRWLNQYEEFRLMYARARREQARLYADHVNEVGERTLRGEIDPQAARVAIDAFKWTAAKMDRATYGDQPAAHTVNVAVGVQVVTPEKIADSQARKRASLERRRAARGELPAPALPDGQTSQDTPAAS